MKLEDDPERIEAMRIEATRNIAARIREDERKRIDLDKAAHEVSRWLYGVPPNGWCHSFAAAVIEAALHSGEKQ